MPRSYSHLLAGLDIIPANLSLYASEFELPVRQQRERGFRFWRMLERGIRTLSGHYDVVVCDCPPSLGYLSINALYATTGLIVPAPASMLDFASTARFFQMMSDTLARIAAVEPGQAKQLQFVRILLTRLDTTDRNQARVAKWMASTYENWLLPVVMPATTALNRVGNLKRSLYELDPADYRDSDRRALHYLEQVNDAIGALIEASVSEETVRAA